MSVFKNRRYILAVAVAAVLAVVAGGIGYSVFAKGDGYRREPLRIVRQDGGSHVFQVELALTPTEQQMGLMFREKMGRDEGMIFYFGLPEREVAFWMKNTLIPLDMIFVRADGTIAHIHHNAQPHSLARVSSQLPVVSVIEVNGGRAADLGLRAGDRVEHRFFAD